MGQRLTPEFFYGSAIAALTGLLCGLLLHIAWEKHPGGPRILFSSTEAAEPTRPAAEDAAPKVPAAEIAAELDTTHVKADPLPVTRLAPDMFDVQPATAVETERQGADDLFVDAPPAPPARDLD